MRVVQTVIGIVAGIWCSMLTAGVRRHTTIDAVVVVNVVIVVDDVVTVHRDRVITGILLENPFDQTQHMLVVR